MLVKLAGSLLLASLCLPLAAQEGGKDKQDKKDAPAAAKVDFQKDVWPILEKRCIECHATQKPGGKKPKGGVVLDGKEGIAASKKGKLFVGKKHADSLVYQSITLPADDEDRMPPPKKGDPLTAAQIETIKNWIDQGADFGNWVGVKKDAADAGKGDKPAETPGDKPKEKGKEKGDPLVRLQKGLTPLPAAALAALQGSPFAVRSVGDESPLLSVSCAGNTEQVDDAALQALLPIAAHVAELDLARTKVGDQGCQVIAKMPRLVALDLRQTQVGNHGVAALAACAELRTLNVFGTKVGDYAMAALGSLKHLEEVYLWQTEVTAAAVVRLREAVPGLRAVVAADLPEPLAEGAGAARRRR